MKLVIESKTKNGQNIISTEGDGTLEDYLNAIASLSSVMTRALRSCDVSDEGISGLLTAAVYSGMKTAAVRETLTVTDMAEVFRRGRDNGT